MASINIEMAIKNATQCQQQIRDVSTQVKQMQSALKLADSEFKLTGDATAMYTSKIQTLQAQIAAQNQAVEAARRGLENMSQAYGANSSQAQNWQSKLNTAQAGLNNMQASLNEMTAKLSESTSKMSETAGAAGNLASALSGMSGGSYSMDGLNSSLGASQAEIAKTSDQIKELQDQVKETGGLFYNVGNMSVSATNGGKMASVITKISGELTKVVKSSGETASNTDGLAGALSGGNVTASGTLGGISSIVSNFGPWGAIAGAVLDLGGAIIDKIVETNEDGTQSAREAAAPAYQGLDRNTLENLTAAMNRRQDFTADVEANIKSEVTAKVDGMRVIIDEITEDGKVNTSEVGSVKRYVEEVLMADYDEAVRELYTMRGELWRIATQGYTSDEVAMYGLRTGDPEQSALFLLFSEALGDPSKVGSTASKIIGDDVESAATQLWLYLSKEFGSTEAMMAAFGDPAQASEMQTKLQEYLSKTFGASLEDSTRFAVNLFNTANRLATEKFSGTNMTVGADWLSTTEGGGVLVAWVQSMLTDADKEKALDYCTDMWLEVMAACSSPTDAANAIWHNTGEEAAAAYMAGEDSATSQTFGAMVEWVKKNLNVKDHAEAIRIATQMWDETRRAASYGSMTATTGVTVDTSWITDSSAGNIFTDWVAANLTEGDKDKAVETATGMWAEVVAAASSPEGAMGSILASSGDEVRDAYESGEKSTRTQTFGTMLAWVKANLSPKDEAQALKWAVDMWNEVRNAASYGNPNGTRITVDSAWITETEAGSVFSDYVASILDEDDKDAAVEKAKGMWTEVVAAASSPEAAIGAMAGSSGEEAAAAAAAGEDSDTAKAFSAMVDWVSANLGADEETAIGIAIGMWDALRNAAFLGIDPDGVDHTAVLTTEKTWASSSAMSDYISERMGTDFETAISNANRYWDDLIKAVNGQTSAAEGTELRATLLEQAMAEYKKTLDEIDAVTESMAGAEGKDLEGKIAQLEALLNRAEALATRIETLTAEEMNQGQGAYNIITYGHGNYDEDDIAQAAAYMNALAEMSEQDYTNAIAEADAARWSVWGNASSTPEERAAADAAYDAAVAQAEAVYNANAVEYARMLSNMMNVILQDEADKAGLGDLSEIDMPEELTKTIVQLASAGVFDGMTIGMLPYLTGPFAEGIYNALDDYTVKYSDSEGNQKSGSLGWIATHDPKASGYTVFGQEFGNVTDLPFYKLASGADPNDLLQTFWTNWADYAEIPSDFDDTEATAAMEATGENLDNTLAASIAANAGGPIAAAAGMATEIVNAIKTILDIRSPSHVMQAFGAYTAEGLAEGIDANIAMVARASGRMAQTVARPVGAVAGAAGNTVNNTSTSSLFVENYYQRSDADIDYLAAAIADKNRLGRMGNGLRT